MISGTMGDNPFYGYRIGQGKDRITGSPGFEGAGLLQVLTFKEKLSAAPAIKGF